MNNIIKVNLPENKSYDILIGSNVLKNITKYINDICSAKHVALITDQNVEKLYSHNIETLIKKNSIKCSKIVLPAGEKTKTFQYLEMLCNQLLDAKIERNDLIICLGGGVVGDLGGFAAGIILRGIKLIQIPTTLLAQVDSSIGGKTAIDTKHGKNLVGIFNQPNMVIADLSTLSSLPLREIKSGYAEIVKYSLINDVDFFEWLEKNGESLIYGNINSIQYAVTSSCKAKAEIVSADENELLNNRILLNLGHTFAHSIEKVCNYDNRIKHGEAVSIGLSLAFELSVNLGFCDEKDFKKVVNHLKSVKLPTDLSFLQTTLSCDELIEPILHDKKSKNNKPNFILAKGIGKAFLCDSVPISEVKKILNKHLMK